MTGGRPREWAPGLFHVAGPLPDAALATRIAVVAIVRNEAWRLPFWLAYHRWLGVGHFIIVNNRSDDETADFLGSQADVTLFDAPGPYQRIAWKRAIVTAAPGDRWSLVLDADELFVSLPWIEGGLQATIDCLDAEGAEAVVAVMVDCYPDTLPLAADRASFVPWRRAPWFDAGPYLKWDAAEGRAHHIFGGVRERLLWPKWRYTRRVKHLLPRKIGRRLFGDGPPFVRKMPLLKNVPTLSFETIHGSKGVRAARELFAILHYKLDVDLDLKVASALEERQYADNSRDYESYARLTNAKSVPVKNKKSVRFAGARALEEASLLSSTPEFDLRLRSAGLRFVDRDQAEAEISRRLQSGVAEQLWRGRWTQSSSEGPLGTTLPSGVARHVAG